MRKSISKKVVYLVIAVLLLQKLVVYASETESSEPSITVLMAQQERAVAANDRINEGMGFTQEGTLDYEDDFAGAKIVEDKLVLGVTDVSETTKAKYIRWAGEYADALEFEYAKYSYNYLFQEAAQVADDTYERTGEEVLGYYVSEARNTVVIKVSKEAESTLSKQRAAHTYDIPVEYEVSEEAVLTSTEVRGGSLLENISTGTKISVGCCGYFRGVPSIATCGHGSSGVGNQCWVDTGVDGFVGTVAYHNFGNGCSGDYAIISGSNSNYVHTNKIGTKYNIKGILSSPAVNTYVYFYGYATKQYCWGKVLERGVTVNVRDNGKEVTVKGLSVVRVLEGTVNSGDSGGTVFTVASGTSDAQFAGVMNVRSTASGYLEMYFTPASYFTSLGFTVKTN